MVTTLIWPSRGALIGFIVFVLVFQLDLESHRASRLRR